MTVLEPAVAADADELVAMRDELARWLLGRGVRQWRPGEVERAQLVAWIEDELVHIVRDDGGIAASVAVLWDDEALWGPGDGLAGYIHLLMVRRDLVGEGRGGEVLRWAEAHIAADGRRIARLDVVSSNERLARWYAERGYTVVRDLDLPDPWFPTTLMEKPLVTS